MEEQLQKFPHTFVFQRGQVGTYVLELVKDVRQVMEPFTAKKLKVDEYCRITVKMLREKMLRVKMSRLKYYW